MQRKSDIRKMLQGYPSYISKEQLCKICHISKRTALRLLEDGSIPCKSNGKQTRKFQIALADVEAFLLKRQARIKINPREARNVYRPMSAEMKSLLPHVVTDWLEPYPDVLSVDEVVQITGYGSSSVVKWCKKEDLQHYCIGRKFFVPKTWLQEFMLSERAFAYRMKLEAMKHQGLRTDLTSVQVGQKLNAREMVAKGTGKSAVQIQRFIRLTYLVPPLLDMVDEHKVAFNPAVELSYLTSEEQTALLDAMDSEQSTPSLSQAQRLKKFSQEGSLSEDIMRAILSEEKKPEIGKITLSGDKLRRYFPKSFTPQQMEQTIFRLLEQWQRRRQRDLER